MKTTSLGIIFGDTSAEKLDGLTLNRTTASLPFGGRYRVIDFTLSAFAHAGVSRVGVLSKRHYRSLMSHVKSGKEWDLSRKHGGLFILPPFSGSEGGIYNNNIEALRSVADFIAAGREDLVILCESDIIFNIDLSAAIKTHVENQNDITVVYQNVKVPSSRRGFEIVNGGIVAPVDVFAGECGNIPVAYIYDRIALLNIIKDSLDYGYNDFERDMVANQQPHCKVAAVSADGICLIADSVKAYYDANMNLLDPAVRDELFMPARFVYTSSGTHMPAKIGDGEVENSLIAEGCDIEGKVRNSVLFRGVKVQKDAVVENSVVLSNAYIDKFASVKYTVADRDVYVHTAHSLRGSEDNPVFAEANRQI